MPSPVAELLSELPLFGADPPQLPAPPLSAVPDPDPGPLDKLSGLLDEADFQRVYRKVKAGRAALEQRLSQIDRPDFPPERQNDLAKELVERFLAAAPTNREVLVSLIERVELTEEKEVILHFRFRELEQKG